MYKRQAYDTAKKENYQSAYDTAYKEAYQSAHDEAYDTAYKEAYEEADVYKRQVWGYAELFRRSWVTVSFTDQTGGCGALCDPAGRSEDVYKRQ